MTVKSGWKLIALGKIAPANSNGMPDEGTEVWNLSLDEVEPVTGRILNKTLCRVSELGSAKCSFDTRHVLYSKLRPYLNKVVLPDESGVGTSELIPMLPDPKQLDREFLAFYLRSPMFLDFANANTRGANLPRIAMKELWKHKVPVPDSLDEQRRIVARIKECMERVEEIEENSQSINFEIEALLPSMLHQRFEELRSRVDIAKLENVTEIKGGGSLPKGGGEDLGKDSVLLVKVGDMNALGNERIIQVSRAYLPASKALKKIIAPGAVIFPKRGGAIATNKKRMLGRPAMIDPNLMAVIAKPERMRAEYLYYWTQTLDLTDISNGGVIPQLNRKDLAPLEIPVPGLDEQELIISELEQAEASCFELRTTFVETHQERHSLRESILRKAFAGEL